MGQSCLHSKELFIYFLSLKFSPFSNFLGTDSPDPLFPLVTNAFNVRSAVTPSSLSIAYFTAALPSTASPVFTHSDPHFHPILTYSREPHMFKFSCSFQTIPCRTLPVSDIIYGIGQLRPMLHAHTPTKQTCSMCSSSTNKMQFISYTRDSAETRAYFDLLEGDRNVFYVSRCAAVMPGIYTYTHLLTKADVQVGLSLCTVWIVFRVHHHKNPFEFVL